MLLQKEEWLSARVMLLDEKSKSTEKMVSGMYSVWGDKRLKQFDTFVYQLQLQSSGFQLVIARTYPSIVIYN